MASVTVTDTALATHTSWQPIYYSGPTVSTTVVDAPLQTNTGFVTPVVDASISVLFYDTPLYTKTSFNPTSGAVRNFVPPNVIIQTWYTPPGTTNVVVDSTTTLPITPNSNLIFTETPTTAAMADDELASIAGVDFNAISAIRKGIPVWRFAKVLIPFAKAFGLDVNQVRAAYAKQIQVTMRTRVTRLGTVGYFGLRDTPVPAMPVSYTTWISTDWNSAPVDSSSLNEADDSAYRVHLWVTGGRVILTLDQSIVSNARFDMMLGPQGSSDGGSGGSMTIDEFDPTNSSGVTLADEERYAFFGFTRPTGATTSTQVVYQQLRVHPNTIRIMAFDSSAMIRYAYEKIGHSWDALD